MPLRAPPSHANLRSVDADSNPKIKIQRDRLTRVERTIALLRRDKGKRVPLPEIQREAGAQHCVRIREARALGYVIDNVMERTANGETHSFYILRAEPGEAVPLFPGAFDLRHRDDG